MALFVTIGVYEGKLNAFYVIQKHKVEFQHQLVFRVNAKGLNSMGKSFPFNIFYLVRLLIFFIVLHPINGTIQIIFFCLGIIYDLPMPIENEPDV